MIYATKTKYVHDKEGEEAYEEADGGRAAPQDCVCMCERVACV